MQNKVRKHKKLAVQISLIVLVTAIAMLYLIGAIVVSSTRNMFIESHNEQITQELEECKYLFMSPEIVGWVLDQWQQDPELSLPPTQEIDVESMEEILTLNRFVEYMDMEALQDFPPDTRAVFLHALYYHAVGLFEEKRAQGKFDHVICIDIRNDDNLYEQDKDDYYIIMECSEEADQNHSQGNSHGLGTYINKDDTYLSVSKMQYGTYGKDYGDIVFQVLNKPRQNTLMYTAAAPVFVDGVLRYVLCLEYNWSSFARLLDASLNYMALWGILVLVCFSIFLYLFVYLKAIRPLAQVNHGVLEYMESKDSGMATACMKKIRETSEVGLLAENLADMIEEIERSSTENLRLTSERKRVETELELAAQIQADSLPAVFPDREEIRLFASMDPAKEVGGDFYDFFFTDDRHLGLVIADVSDKGVPAALFMMMSKNMIKNYAMMGLSPSEVMNRTNESLCENNQNGMFLTVWFGILDLETGHVVASNAGHEYPLIRKADSPFELFKDKHGIPLGLMRVKPYSEYEFDIEKGGTLFVYTDGAPEATDAREQLFGTDRMLEALNREPGAEPEKLLQNMKSAITRFVGDAPQFDDTTMLCVKMNVIPLP